MIPSFRFFAYASLIICASVFVVSEFILKLPIVNDSVRQKVANELSQTFSRDISVGSIKGGVLSTIVLDDVTISSGNGSFEFPMAEIDKIIVDLSPKVFFGNVSEGIQTATFDGVTLNVVRSKDKKINIFEFIKIKGRSTSSLFSGTLNFKDIRGVFYDYRGWRKRASSFQQPFENGNGQIVFQKDSTVNLNFNTFFADEGTKISIDGEVKGPIFFYEFDVDQLYLDRWGDYLLPSSYFKITDDFVSVKGSIQRSPNVDYTKMKIPFHYSVDIGFDYMAYKQKNFPYPIQNLNGRVLMSNEDGTIFHFDALRGEINQIPIEIDGHLYLDKKVYDIGIMSTESVSLEYLLSNFQLKSQLPLFTDLNFDIDIMGSFRSPKIVTNVYSDQVKLDTYDLGRLDIQFLSNRRHTIVKSLDDSDFEVNGILRKKTFQLDLALDTLKLPIINENKPLKLIFLGAYRNPNIELHLLDFNYDLYGYSIDQIVASMNLTAGSLNVLGASADLDNGQTIYYSGLYDFKDMALTLKQAGVSSPTGNVSREIKEMDSTISFIYKNQKWQLNFNAGIEGNIANVYDIDLDYYKLSLNKTGDLFNISIDLLQKDDQRVSGIVNIKSDSLESVSLQLESVKLKNIGILFPQINKFDLTGIVSGAIDYDNQDKIPFYNGQVSVLDFNAIYGQFGDMELDFTHKDNILDIVSLKLSKIHNARLKGRYVNENDFNIEFFNSSSLRLDAFKYFSKLKLFGEVELVGELSKTGDGFFYDGYLESDELEFDTHEFDYVFADLDISKDNISVKHSRILFEKGELNVKGDVTNIFNVDVSLGSVDYDLDVIFNKFALTSVMKFYQSYDRVHKNILDTEDLNLLLNSSYIYHKYEQDNTQVFDSFKAAVDRQNSLGTLPDISGYLDGRIKVNRSPNKPNVVDLSIRDFRFSDYVSFDHLTASTAFINNRQDRYSIAVKKFSYFNDSLEEFKFDFDYFSDTKVYKSFNQFIHYKGRKIKNPFMFSYSVEDRFLDVDFELIKNDAVILSLLSPKVLSVENNGSFEGRIYGPLHDLNVTADTLNLLNFRLKFDPKYSMFDSELFIKDFETKIKDNELRVDRLMVYWQGDDTFRKVTRSQRQNSFLFYGGVTFKLLDFVDTKMITIDYDLLLKPTYISMNFSEFYAGDIRLTSETTLIGEQEYPLTKKKREQVNATLGSVDEKGPLLTSNMTFLDGIFNIGNFRSKKSKMRIALDLDVTMGPGNYVQGSIFGDGIFNLANNIYLEVDKAMEKKPFNVQGSLNRVDINTAIDFYEGSITIFDGVYQLLRSESQAHYFQELPELVSPQQIQIRPITVDGVSRLSFDMNLRALRIKDYNVSTENIRDDDYPYQAVGLVINGPLENISSGFKVLDFGLDSYTASYPSYLFYGQYDVNFNSQQNFTSQTYYGLNLIMPSIVTDSEDTSFAQFGRQQINNFIKSSIRPYERRLARRIGLYDLRIDYDFGRTLFYSDQDLFTNREDLLGINFISDLYDERLLLDLRTDINLSSEEVDDDQRGVKVTQLELRYQVSNNLSFGMKNINEYSEITEFDPRFSISYGYSF